MMENYDAQTLAEKIANLLRENETGSDNFLRASFDKINQRLDNIESQMNLQIPNSKFQISNHSSQEKFTNLEDFADEIINGLQAEKACPFEPTGKPCDHCAMCSSRGF